MEPQLHILLLEDSEVDADLLIRFLKKSQLKFTFKRVWDESAFIKEIETQTFDLIISDHSMPQFTGIEAFRIIKKKFKHLPFIIVTGTLLEHTLAEMVKEGIDDYIFKDNLLRLPSAISHVVAKKKIERLHAQLERAHKDITDSINYAKNIQSAVLPEPEVLHNLFPESFVLFQPRDVVSGDFYYFKQEKNICYIVAADCTGHGVPGAFLSILGIEKIKQLLHPRYAPAEILRRLDANIQQAFAHSNDKENHSGMDIALCAYDVETHTLEFSGANRPLWIVRKGEDAVEEIKGNKKGIGHASGNSIDKDFKTQQVKLNCGDTFYMLTDGFADQFGGPSGKKITAKKLKNLLLGIQNLNLSKQKEYLSEFMEVWKNKDEQVDDILMIGVSV